MQVFGNLIPNICYRRSKAKKDMLDIQGKYKGKDLLSGNIGISVFSGNAYKRKNNNIVRRKTKILAILSYIRLRNSFISKVMRLSKKPRVYKTTSLHYIVAGWFFNFLTFGQLLLVANHESNNP